MNGALHVSECPEAKDFPSCAQQGGCSLSCLLLNITHLEKCTRCVQHLVGNDDQERGCLQNHCLRIYYCWQLRGDFIDCLYKCKVKVGTYSFEKIVKQLQTLFDLDFNNIVYQKKGAQIKRSEIVEITTTPTKSTIHSTETLFCFVDIFRTFKTNLELCNMTIDSGDLCGILQTMIHQMEEHPDDLLKSN